MAPPSAPPTCPKLTTVPTYSAGNISEAVVKILADQPWCALVAMHNNATAVHIECSPPANAIGTTRQAHVSIAARRAAFNDIPRRTYPFGSQPPNTLPMVEQTYTTIRGNPMCERSSLNSLLKYPGS